MDNDCDGEADGSDAVDAFLSYLDGDGDGWGDDEWASLGCTTRSDQSVRGGDCDDSDPSRWPGAPEVCNGIDDDCDGQIDEDALDAQIYFQDLDADGYGVDTATAAGCSPPSGHAAMGGDCDDTDGQVHPGQLDDCSDGDGDCDGAVDENCCPGCVEICEGGVDEDLDERIDCGDSDCSGLPQCCVLGAEVCWDWLDNDGDGLVDCDDTDDCALVGWCRASECANGIDDDADGLIDEQDPACSVSSTTVTPAWPAHCAAAAGGVDCSRPGCSELCAENCFDAVDNDGDGLVDCDDADCDGLARCQEVCGNGLDEDGDGLIDEALCIQEDCGNGLDDDFDGATDCADLDCGPGCVERCADGSDNDDDGLVDCEDGDCATHGSCVEVCDDQYDNDGDALIDCWDDDCAGPGCAGATRSQVLGGFVHQVDVRSAFSWSAFTYVNHVRVEHIAEGVVGEVEVMGADGQVAARCDWGLGMRREARDRRRSWAISPSSWSASTTVSSSDSATGFWIDTGCPLGIDDVVPKTLRWGPWGGAADVTAQVVLGSGGPSGANAQMGAVVTRGCGWYVLAPGTCGVQAAGSLQQSEWDTTYQGSFYTLPSGRRRSHHTRRSGSLATGSFWYPAPGTIP